MRGEKLIYKLTAKGFSVSIGAGGPVFITMENIAAGMTYGHISLLQYHLLMSLIQPPIVGDRVIQFRKMARQEEGATFNLESAYRYLIETFVAKTDLDRAFYSHMALVAKRRKWRLKAGKEVTRHMAQIALVEKLVPWLCTCMNCRGRGEIAQGPKQKVCKACTGQRPAEAPTGETVYIGSGMRELSGRSMARLLYIDNKSYEQTWRERRQIFELELDAQIRAGLRKLANTIFDDLPKKPTGSLTGADPKPVEVKERLGVERFVCVGGPVPNHAAIGRKTLSRRGCSC